MPTVALVTTASRTSLATFRAWRPAVRRRPGTGCPRAPDGRRLAEIRSELAGFDLACWCKLGDPCHADVLLELANGGAS
jgi:hypothetical protein